VAAVVAIRTRDCGFHAVSACAAGPAGATRATGATVAAASRYPAAGATGATGAALTTSRPRSAAYPRLAVYTVDAIAAGAPVATRAAISQDGEKPGVPATATSAPDRPGTDGRSTFTAFAAIPDEQAAVPAVPSCAAIDAGAPLPAIPEPGG
jgi:hypothetical protein